MKRLSTAALTMTACMTVAFAGVATAGKGGDHKGDTVREESKVRLAYTDGDSDPYGESYFWGRVRAQEGCNEDRKVSIKGIGKAKTSSSGKFKISAGSGAEPGTYQARVKKMIVRNEDEKIICERATSNEVTVP